MLLESRVTVLDPQNRNMDLTHILGRSDYPPSWTFNNDGILTMTFQKAWVDLQGPSGILNQLNQLGLLNERSQPFRILSQQEYNAQIFATCTLL